MADIVRYAGQGFIERSRKWINGQHQKVLLAIRALPHRCAGWTSRSVRQLRTHRHLL
jgi:hypothetical protein